MKLVDGDALKEALSIFKDVFKNGDPHFLNGIKIAREIIDDAPTIDAIPVEWMEQRMNETADGLELNFELNNALFIVGVEWERWKKENVGIVNNENIRCDN